MPDENRFLQFELLNELCQVIRVSIHLVPVPGLARSPMTASVMRNAAIAVGRQKVHLVVPGVSAQRPAMTENYGLSLAPILVIKIDFSRIFLANCDKWHL